MFPIINNKALILLMNEDDMPFAIHPSEVGQLVRKSNIGYSGFCWLGATADCINVKVHQLTV